MAHTRSTPENVHTGSGYVLDRVDHECEKYEHIAAAKRCALMGKQSDNV